MTLEDSILQRSYLPKNGTYTMEDHILAMQMDIVGESGIVTVANNTTPISVAETKASLKVKEDTIVIKIDVTTDTVVVSDTQSEVKVV